MWERSKTSQIYGLLQTARSVHHSITFLIRRTVIGSNLYQSRFYEMKFPCPNLPNSLFIFLFFIFLFLFIYLFFFFFVVTSHHFVDPPVLSVSDFG